MKEDRVGEKYTTNEGYGVEIIEYLNKNKCTILFEDGLILENKKFNDVKKGRIKNPYHKSVYNLGYIGQGNFKRSFNRQNTKSYTSWVNMIGRCYNEKELLKYPTYVDCSVAECWHNFQNFAKWFEENYRPEIMQGWHLDKDILVKGNKVYSPETCCFVPQEINTLFTSNKAKRGDYPIGVNFSKENIKFVAQINNGNKNQKHLGYFNTPEESFQAYKKAKEQYIKEVAEKWKGLISDKVYEAMHKYNIEIVD